MTEQPVDEQLIEKAVMCLTAAAAGDLEKAQEYADLAADSGSLLGTALATYLRTSARRDVYAQPAAFEAFIAGGGNIDLYRRTSAVLAAAYPGVTSLLDIGCGNGLALVPALQLAGPAAPTQVELVEPGADLLAHCVGAIGASGQPVQITGHQVGLTDFLEAAPPARRWQLAQSTFALQSIEPGERLVALTRLARRVDRIVVVDFDVPDEKPGSRQQIQGLAARYERGLAEYDETRELVAQGFLMPVLLGQLSGQATRTNWEQPAEKWRAEFAAAGFRHIQIQPLADYFSAPAFLLTATGSPGPAPATG